MRVYNCLAKQLLTLVEFCCHVENVNAEGVTLSLKDGQNNGQATATIRSSRLDMF